MCVSGYYIWAGNYNKIPNKDNYNIFLKLSCNSFYESIVDYYFDNSENSKYFPIASNIREILFQWRQFTIESRNDYTPFYKIKYNGVVIYFVLSNFGATDLTNLSNENWTELEFEPLFKPKAIYSSANISGESMFNNLSFLEIMDRNILPNLEIHSRTDDDVSILKYLFNIDRFLKFKEE
jgi:hypothetical protein